MASDSSLQHPDDASLVGQHAVQQKAQAVSHPEAVGAAAALSASDGHCDSATVQPGLAHASAVHALQPQPAAVPPGQSDAPLHGGMQHVAAAHAHESATPMHESKQQLHQLLDMPPGSTVHESPAHSPHMQAHAADQLTQQSLPTSSVLPQLSFQEALGPAAAAPPTGPAALREASPGQQAAISPSAALQPHSVVSSRAADDLPLAAAAAAAKAAPAAGQRSKDADAISLQHKNAERPENAEQPQGASHGVQLQPAARLESAADVATLDEAAAHVPAHAPTLHSQVSLRVMLSCCRPMLPL